MALRRIDIVQGDREWVAKSDGQVVDRSARKADLVRSTAATARSTAAPTSVRIHGRNGRIQEERTYGPDPRRSRG